MNKKDIERFGSIIEDQNEPTDWGGRVCIAIGIIFISYLIARTVATFVWGV